MNTFSLLSFTALFICIVIYLSQNYTKFGMSENAWLIVTIIAGVVFAALYIREHVMKYKKEKNNAR